MSTNNVLLATIATVLVVGGFILIRDRTCHNMLMGDSYTHRYELYCGGGNWYVDKYNYIRHNRPR